MPWQKIKINDAKLNMSKVIPYDSDLSLLDKKQAYYHNNRLTALKKYTTNEAIGYKCYKRKGSTNNKIDIGVSEEPIDYIEVNTVTEGGTSHVLDVAAEYFKVERLNSSYNTKDVSNTFGYGFTIETKNGTKLYLGDDVTYWSRLTITELGIYPNAIFLIDDPELNSYQVMRITGTNGKVGNADRAITDIITLTLDKNDTTIIDRGYYYYIESKSLLTKAIALINISSKDDEVEQGQKFINMKGVLGSGDVDERQTHYYFYKNGLSLGTSTSCIQFWNSGTRYQNFRARLNIVTSLTNVRLSTFYSEESNGINCIVNTDYSYIVYYNPDDWKHSSNVVYAIHGSTGGTSFSDNFAALSWSIYMRTVISFFPTLCSNGLTDNAITFDGELFGNVEIKKLDMYVYLRGSSVTGYSKIEFTEGPKSDEYPLENVSYIFGDKKLLAQSLVLQSNNTVILTRRINNKPGFVINYVQRQPVSIGYGYKTIVRLDTQGTKLVGSTNDSILVSQNQVIYRISVDRMFADAAYNEEVNIIESDSYCSQIGGYLIFNTTSYNNAVYRNDSTKVFCSCDDWNSRFLQNKRSVDGSASVSFNPDIEDLASDQTWLVSGLATNLYTKDDLSKYLKSLTSGSYTITSTSGVSSVATVTNGQGIVRATSRIGHFWNSTRSFEDIPAKVISDEQIDFDLFNATTTVDFSFCNPEYTLHKDATAFLYYSNSYTSDAMNQQYRITSNGFVKDFSDINVFTHNSLYELVPSLLFTTYLKSENINLIQVGSETYKLKNYSYAATTPALVFDEESVSINIDPTTERMVIQGALYEISGDITERRIRNPYDTSTNTYCCDVTGLRYLGYDSEQGYFFSPATGIIYTFNGANKLNAFIELDSRIPLEVGRAENEQVGIGITNIPSMNIIAMAFTDGVLIIASGQSVFIEVQNVGNLIANKELGLIKINGSYYYFGTNNTINNLVDDVSAVVSTLNIKTCKIGVDRDVNQTCNKHRICLYNDTLEDTTFDVTITSRLGDKINTETYTENIPYQKFVDNEYQFELNPKYTKSNWFTVEINGKNCDLLDYFVNVEPLTEENLVRHRKYRRR